MTAILCVSGDTRAPALVSGLKLVGHPDSESLCAAGALSIFRQLFENQEPWFLRNETNLAIAAMRREGTAVLWSRKIIEEKNWEKIAKELGIKHMLFANEVMGLTEEELTVLYQAHNGGSSPFFESIVKNAYEKPLKKLSAAILEMERKARG